MSQLQPLRAAALALLLGFGLQAAAQTSLICQDTGPVSLATGCTAEITLDALTEGTLPPLSFDVEVFAGSRLVESFAGVTDENAILLLDGIAVSGGVYTVPGANLRFRISGRDPVTQAPVVNCGFRSLTIDIDRAAPVFVDCGAVTQVSCASDLSAVALPSVAPTACGDPITVTRGSFTVTGDFCAITANQVLAEAQVVAVNPLNNTSATCTQTVELTRPTAAELQALAPEDITFTCEQFQDNPGITAATPLASVIVDADPATPGIQVDPALDLTNVVTGAGAFPDLSGNGGVCMYNAFPIEETVFPRCAPNAAGVVPAFKIVRTQRVLDMCTNDIVTLTQNILVLETSGPAITVPAMLELNANAAPLNSFGACRATGFLPFPILGAGACSAVDPTTVSVSTPVGPGILRTIGGRRFFEIPAPGIELGTTFTATYSAATECGASSTATTTVTVVDNSPPVAVCDEITNLSLTNTPTTRLLAADLDDGSYDLCGDVFFKAIRMDELNAVPISPTVGRALTCDQANSDKPRETQGRVFFDDEIFYCCEDLDGQFDTVIVRVFDVDPGPGAVEPNRLGPNGDLFGRFNDCMVEIELEDKLPPTLVLPAPDRTISCEAVGLIQMYLAPDSVGFDAPIFADACDFTVSLAVSDTRDKCNDGAIRRTFTVVDANGNTGQTFTQTITVEDVQAFTVEFPADVMVNGCGALPTAPGAVVTDEGCNVTLVATEDSAPFVGGAGCSFILRKYTVANCCLDAGANGVANLGSFVPNLSASPELRVAANGDVFVDGAFNAALTNQPLRAFCYSQKISINDNVLPVVSTPQVSCVASVQGGAPGACMQGTTIAFTATDDCAAAVSVDYVLTNVATGVSVTAATDNFGGVVEDPLAPGTFVYNGLLPLGSYTFTAQAFDDCNPVTPGTASVSFDVEDCKPPTAKGRVIATTPMISQMIDITPSDLDAGSFDDCTAIDLFVRRASERTGVAPTTTAVTLTCADIANFNGRDTVDVDLYVVDAAGNVDFVTVGVDLQDNFGVCSAPTRLRLAGDVDYTGNQGVRNVEVTVSGGYFNAMTTPADGHYEFDDIAPGTDVTVTPSRVDWPMNGVTSLDFYYISRHILGTEPLATPEQLIAADVNNSGNVSAIDITTARRVMLGITPGFPNGQTSWRFIDGGYAFPQPTNPWLEAWPETVSYNDIATDMMGADFRAIKIGDVNGSARTNTTGNLGGTDLHGRGARPFALVADDAALTRGEVATVYFEASDAEALAYQMTLTFDPVRVEVLDVIGGAHAAENFGTHLLAEGMLTMSHHGAMRGRLFGLRVRSLVDAQRVSDLFAVGSEVTDAVAYDATGAALPTTLRFGGRDAAATAINALAQNRPNPFTGETLIAFELADAGEAVLTVRDAAGREVWRSRRHLAAGTHRVSLARADLPGAGVYTYTLTAGDFSATRTMVIVD